MPATSAKQKRFMDAAAHNPAFAKAAGIPVSVAKEFSESSKGKTFGSGGSKSRADVQAINKPKTNHGESGLFAKGGAMKHEDVKMDKSMMQKAVNKHEGRLHKGQPMTKLAGGGTFRTSANGVATKGKTKGTMIKMNKGGMSC
jgi:hypothetical protein